MAAGDEVVVYLVCQVQQTVSKHLVIVVVVAIDLHSELSRNYA